MQSHWLHLFNIPPCLAALVTLVALVWFFYTLCVFKCLLKLLASENAKSQWLHFSTLINVWFLTLYLCAFSNILSNCLPLWMQIPHCLHLFNFAPCLKVTLSLVVLWLFSTMHFQRVTAGIDAKSHWSHLFDYSPLCVIKCLLKLTATKNEKSHWLHVFNFSPGLKTFWHGEFVEYFSHFKII